MTKKPSYRFAGYTESWEDSKLGECTKISAGGDIEKSKLLNNGKYPVIANALTSDGIVGYYNDSYRIEAPAVTVTGRGDVGVAKARNVNFTPVVRLLSLKSEHDVIFLENAINTQKIVIESTGVPQLTAPQLGRYKIFFPSLPEQTAIGSFFQDIDQLISLQQRKLEVLKEQKKTYLKLLFPAKGQTKPALRFAGFEDDWKEVKLGEVTELKRGLTYKPTSVVENGTRVLRSSNIDGDVFKKQEDDIFVEDSSVTIPYVQFGDILITAANGSSKLVGKHAIIEDSEKMVHGGFMLLARSKQYKFLNALLSSEWYSRFINVSVSGGNGAIGNLSKSNLEKEIVLCPTIPEQQAIGSFFKDLDKTVAKQEEKVNQLKESKQTLLRKMFI